MYFSLTFILSYTEHFEFLTHTCIYLIIISLVYYVTLLFIIIRISKVNVNMNELS